MDNKKFGGSLGKGMSFSLISEAMKLENLDYGEVALKLAEQVENDSFKIFIGEDFGKRVLMPVIKTDSLRVGKIKNITQIMIFSRFIKEENGLLVNLSDPKGKPEDGVIFLIDLRVKEYLQLLLDVIKNNTVCEVYIVSNDYKSISIKEIFNSSISKAALERELKIAGVV